MVVFIDISSKQYKVEFCFKNKLYCIIIFIKLVIASINFAGVRYYYEK